MEDERNIPKEEDVEELEATEKPARDEDEVEAHHLKGPVEHLKDPVEHLK